MQDYKTINQNNRETQEYNKWFKEEENRILRMSNPVRKMKAWQELHNVRLPILGLTPEELSEINNLVY